MTRFRERLILPILLGLALSASMAGTTSASAPWVAGCSGFANSQYLCIYSDRDLQGNFGHMATDNANYAGQTYPSSTMGVNDSVSSTENLFNNHDVIWHHEANNSGDSLCVNTNTAATWVGLFHNDAFSSHAVAGTGAC